MTLVLPQDDVPKKYSVAIPNRAEKGVRAQVWIISQKTALELLENEVTGRPHSIVFRGGIAKKLLTIPRGGRVCLRLARDDAASPIRTDFLDQFAENDIFLIGFVFAWIDKESLVPLKRHKGLRILYFVSPYGIKDDDSLAPLAEMPWIQVLQIGSGSYVHITDNGLKHIGKMSGLRALYMPNVSVGDQGVKYLENLANLKTLDLASTRITDAGIATLKPHRRLEVLRIGGTRISDKSFVFLAKLPNLKELRVNNTAITGKTLSNLQMLENLRVLDLSSTAIADSEFKSFRHNTLHLLALNDTALTDVCMEDMLDRFPKLAELQVVGTHITPSFLEHLKKLRPGLKVITKRPQIPRKPIRTILGTK